MRTALLYSEMDRLNIGPKIYYSRIKKDRLIIVMEYLPTKLTIEHLAADITAVSALAIRMHAAGYLHGDLHCENVRLNSRGEVRFIDFETMSRVTNNGITDVRREGVAVSTLVREYIDNGFKMNVTAYWQFEFIKPFQNLMAEALGEKKE